MKNQVPNPFNPPKVILQLPATPLQPVPALSVTSTNLTEKFTSDKLREELAAKAAAHISEVTELKNQLALVTAELEKSNAVISKLVETNDQNVFKISELNVLLQELRKRVEPFRVFATLHGAMPLIGRNSAVITEENWKDVKAL